MLVSCSEKEYEAVKAALATMTGVVRDAVSE